ncbi:hypothetical protein C7M84_007917 [Penaeus vannamei]|uniref:Uncharacterized protein n=1 Tax=Penaeus vannamei TaxID=6689 RepID=A0A3R7MDS2_PENVA|nr:hypothetical protein C7M84_007917 [Penaeus vannamei]
MTHEQIGSLFLLNCSFGYRKIRVKKTPPLALPLFTPLPFQSPPYPPLCHPSPLPPRPPNLPHPHPPCHHPHHSRLLPSSFPTLSTPPSRPLPPTPPLLPPHHPILLANPFHPTPHPSPTYALTIPPRPTLPSYSTSSPRPLLPNPSLPPSTLQSLLIPYPPHFPPPQRLPHNPPHHHSLLITPPLTAFSSPLTSHSLITRSPTHSLPHHPLPLNSLHHPHLLTAFLINPYPHSLLITPHPPHYHPPHPHPLLTPPSPLPPPPPRLGPSLKGRRRGPISGRRDPSCVRPPPPAVNPHRQRRRRPFPPEFPRGRSLSLPLALPPGVLRWQVSAASRHFSRISIVAVDDSVARPGRGFRSAISAESSERGSLIEGHCLATLMLPGDSEGKLQFGLRHAIQEPG